MHEGDRVSITLTISGLTDGNIILDDAIYSGTATSGEDYTGSIILGSVGFAGRTYSAGDLSITRTLVITDDTIAEPDQTITLAVPRARTDLSGSTTRDTFTRGPDLVITILANDGYTPPVVTPDPDPVTPPVVTPDPGPGTPPVTPNPATDDPIARTARVEAPTAAVAKGVGQLAAGAVVQRLRFNAGGVGNTLTVAGRDMNGDGMETLAAQYLASGRELSAAELLRQSGFSFTGGDGGRGFNFWGGGSYVSADGDDNGVKYDGDTTAFHVGIDTHWRDGLIGVAIGTNSGDTDFTVTADGMKSKLETDVVSVHPYLTRRFNNSQLYLTVGHGSGDAELKENDGTLIKTDLTVTTAAFGITHALGEQLAARASALYSRAELDAATGDGKSLPATDADSTRITAGLEAAWLAGPWRLFLASDARHDSGDGDTGGALDLGGGVEWKSPTVFVRLEGGGHLLGQDAADESRVNFTARKSTGRVTLGLNLGADATGLDTARLLYGEWRF